MAKVKRSKKGKKILKTNIHGDTWTYSEVTPQEMVGICGEEVEGLTNLDEHHIYINADYLNQDVVIHELVHAYKSYLCLETTNLTGEQLEEIYCEFFSKNWHKIITKSAQILLDLRDITESSDEFLNLVESFILLKAYEGKGKKTFTQEDLQAAKLLLRAFLETT
jgi:hypothetical protein